VSVFKGIPYARADRFGPPRPVGAWDGELDATTYGPQAPQLPGLLERALGTGSLPAAEDCLSLNVFTPGCDDRGRPVVVWIHGGAFTTGGGAMPWYDGTELAGGDDVVVVTINYRLGALGFSGRTNCGLRDQVEALRWVGRDIAALGGDPGNVTIVGESAGGSSVVALMATPAADGLYHRAFAMSPSLQQLRSGARADEALGEFLRAVGAASLDELRDAPVEALLAAQATILAQRSGAGFTGFSPCADGELVPRPIVEAAAENPVPLVVGTTRDEMLLFTSFDPAMADVDEARLRAHVAHRFGEGAQVALDRYRAARPGATNGQLISHVQTDEVFRRPAQALAEARHHAGTPTWMYWFTWASPAFGGVLGSCHAVDVPFLFRNLERNGVPAFTGDGADRAGVAASYSAALASLARTGTPGWSPYELDRRATMRIDVTSAEVDDPEQELRVLWSS